MLLRKRADPLPLKPLRLCHRHWSPKAPTAGSGSTSPKKTATGALGGIEGNALTRREHVAAPKQTPARPQWRCLACGRSIRRHPNRSHAILGARRTQVLPAVAPPLCRVGSRRRRPRVQQETRGRAIGPGARPRSQRVDGRRCFATRSKRSWRHERPTCIRRRSAAPAATSNPETQQLVLGTNPVGWGHQRSGFTSLSKLSCGRDSTCINLWPLIMSRLRVRARLAMREDHISLHAGSRMSEEPTEHAQQAPIAHGWVARRGHFAHE